MRDEGFASWVFRQMNMGCWGEDVGVIRCSGVYGRGLGRRVYSSGFLARMFCKLLAVRSLFFWQWEHPPLAVGTYNANGNFLLAVGSPFFWQWEHPPLAVGTYNANGNFLLAVGMPCAFYSQHIGPFKVIERIGPVAYKLELPNKLYGIHDTFHVSNIKRCFMNDDVVISLDEVQLDDKLHFVEKPVEIMDREVKRLK
nr:reverse transcriptase domain-containing protein [Tanacetum cinerariifolium]